MKSEDAMIGTRVKALVATLDVPYGTEGLIDEDTGISIRVAWDAPDRPLPSGYVAYAAQPEIGNNLLREEFLKNRELIYLTVV